MSNIATLPQVRCIDGDANALDDAVLVAAARRQASSFAPLYERYRDRIYAYMRLHTPRAEDAADLTQQVFLQAFGALAQYRPQRGTFAAWLFRIARNAAIDEARRRQVVVAWNLLPETLQPRADDDPEDAILQAEALERLRVVLTACPPSTRELLALRFTAGLTSAEIAVVVGVSAGVRVRHPAGLAYATCVPSYSLDVRTFCTWNRPRFA